jgi:SAM-dependent methyltransferase
LTDSNHYAIRGGIEGRERLRVLSRVMHASSISLFDRLGLRDGLLCVDVGCGGGDTALELARRVGPHGKAVGIDLDEIKLDIARAEARQQNVSNVEFQACDIRNAGGNPAFDLAYSRFLLTHLKDPDTALCAIYRQLRPGGVAALEDIDFSGSFTYPDCPAFRRYLELYCATVSRRGGDPNIGPRLPSLLHQAGFEDIGLHVVQPVGTQGEVKLLNPLTMENIADAVLADGLATPAEIDDIVHELYAFAADPTTVAGLPRVVQAWGRRPAA